MSNNNYDGRCEGRCRTTGSRHEECELPCRCMCHKFVLVRSDQGDGGWSLHERGVSDDAVADGDAPLLTSGTAVWDDDGECWSRPNDVDFADAENVQLHMPEDSEGGDDEGDNE